MKSKTTLIDHSSIQSDTVERNRIYESFKRRVSDFEESATVDFVYTLILNPSEFELRNSLQLNENIYWNVQALQYSDTQKLGVLRTKFILFRFDKKGINNILIIIEPALSNRRSILQRDKINNSLFALALDLFNSHIFELIHKFRDNNHKAFVCLVGDNQSAIDLFVACYAEQIGRKATTIAVNDVLKDNTLLKNTFARNDHFVIFLKDFDFLFSDLTSSPKIPNREFSMIRHDLMDGAINNETNTIFLQISSPLLLPKEMSNCVSLVKDLSQLPTIELKKFVEKQLSCIGQDDLVISYLKCLPTRHILQTVYSIKTNLINHPEYNAIRFLESYNKEYKDLKAEFCKVEGTDFKISSPDVSLDRVVLSNSNKDKLQMALSSIVNQKLVYHIWGFSEIDSNIRTIINFYGPPGTGKTLCANAIANELSKRTGSEYQLLSLNYSEIESMYVGEAPKKLERVFNFAKDKNLVLFFDEADSFLGKRIQNVSQGSEQAINSLRSTMLIQLEKYTGVVIFATNLTTNYDSAFKTRFLAEIEFPLPDKETCKLIFRKNIPSKLYTYIQNGGFSDEEYELIATELNGLSGRDIKTIIWRVLLRESQKEGVAHYFTSSYFLEEIRTYKDEKKQQMPLIDTSNLSTSVTPASKEMAKRLGLDQTSKLN